jgi:hypothetical protein
MDLNERTYVSQFKRSADSAQMRQRKSRRNSPLLPVAVVLAVSFAMIPSAPAQSFLNAGASAAGLSPSDSQPAPESFLSLWAPLKPQKQFAPYSPITQRQRLRWFLSYTFGPSHLVGGAIISGATTALDRPPEYGTHWGGFGDRYGLRLSGIVPQNAVEAGLGLAVGEDPRYFSARGLPFKARLANVVRLTFVARHIDGGYGPAYARYAAISGSNFASNGWRPHSEANTQSALVRIGAGFAGRMAVNAFEEFWPSVRDHFFSKN